MCILLTFPNVAEPARSTGRRPLPPPPLILRVPQLSKPDNALTTVPHFRESGVTLSFWFKSDEGEGPLNNMAISSFVRHCLVDPCEVAQLPVARLMPNLFYSQQSFLFPWPDPLVCKNTSWSIPHFNKLLAFTLKDPMSPQMFHVLFGCKS